MNLALVDEKPSTSNEDDNVIPISETFRRSKQSLLIYCSTLILFFNSTNLVKGSQIKISVASINLSISMQFMAIFIIATLIYFYLTYLRAYQALKVKSTQFFFQKTGEELAGEFEKLSQKLRKSSDESRFLKIDLKELKDQFQLGRRHVKKLSYEVDARIGAINNLIAGDTRNLLQIYGDEFMPDEQKARESKVIFEGFAGSVLEEAKSLRDWTSKIISFEEDQVENLFEGIERQRQVISKEVILQEFGQIITASEEINRIHGSIGKRERVYHFLLDFAFVHVIFLFTASMAFSFMIFSLTSFLS